MPITANSAKAHRVTLRHRAHESVRQIWRVGNRTAAADDFGTHSYGYDALDRLTSAVHPSSGALSIQNETFSYDAVGNRLSDAVRSAYNYNAGNQLTGDSVYTYSYDNNGNLTTRTRTSDGAQDHFTYSGENRLTQAAMATGYTVNYRYDASGRRLSRRVVHGGEEVSAENYVYDGSNMLAAVSPSGEVRTLYTHGLGMDSPLMLSKGSSNYFMLGDGLGSIIAVTDAQGNVVERMQYQAYGKPVFMDATGTVSPVSISGSHYSYTGREYDADAGRFIQKDPIGFEGGDANLYAYVRSNPIKFVDSSGLDATIFTINGGHVGVKVGDVSSGYMYAEFAGDPHSKFDILRSIVPFFRSYGEVIISVNKPSGYLYYELYTVKQTPQDDKLMLQHIEELQEEANAGKYKYNLFGNSCFMFALESAFNF